MSFQSISDLNGAIASLADWGQKIWCEFFEIKIKNIRKIMKHKGLVSNPCSKSAPRQGFVGILPETWKCQLFTFPRISDHPAAFHSVLLAEMERPDL